jgi:hypothetical protein
MVWNLETGIVAAFRPFGGTLPDMHIFQMNNGKAENIQSVIGAAAKSTGWTAEEVLKN